MKWLMLRHAFRFVNSVVFLVGPHNLRSQRAVERIGGVRAGTRLDGGGRESLVYRIEASAFATGLGGPGEPLYDPLRWNKNTTDDHA
jgi:hypothetical protein